jgi:hypothetical protein
MKATIRTISPKTYVTTFELENDTMYQLLAQLTEIQDNLLQAGYLPNGELPRTAEGLPICTRHAVPLRQREKQGDTWYSHSVTDPQTGQILYCKGRPGKDSPGWQVDIDPACSSRGTEPRANNGTAEPQAQAEPNTPTAFWQIATTLITAGKITQDQAGQIAQGPGDWTDKATHLVAA